MYWITSKDGSAPFSVKAGMPDVSSRDWAHPPRPILEITESRWSTSRMASWRVRFLNGGGLEGLSKDEIRTIELARGDYGVPK